MSRRRTTSQVANRAGLEALGAQVSAGGPPAGPATSGKGKSGKGSTPAKPPRHRHAAPRPHRWRRRVVVGLTSLVVLAGALAAAGWGYAHYEWSRVSKEVCHSCRPAPAPGQPFNVLIIGSDSRSGDTGQAATSFGSSSSVGGQRSDTIKIVHVDPASGTARVLSIPRDTYVTMSGLAPSTGLTGAQKINTAFNNGPDALVQTIEHTFGIPINHWVVINFSAVIDAVQALGGISLDFADPVRDMNTETGVNESGLDITQTGCQDLDGNTVLALSRSRYYEYYADGEWHQDPGYDLSRIERQNVIIEAMIDKAHGTTNPIAIESLINGVAPHLTVDTDLSLGTLYDLAERYHAFSPSSLASWTLPTTGVTLTVGGAPDDVEVVDTDGPDNYEAAIEQFLGGPSGPVTTPPLGQDGEPVVVPTTTTTTAPTTTAPPATVPVGSTAAPSSTPSTSAPSTSTTTTTTLPPYDPTLC